MRSLNPRFVNVLPFVCLLFAGIFSLGLNAQQEAMYTKYMFNSLVYNPGYAGTKDALSINFLHRTQWLGIKGGPSAQTFTLHAPMGAKKRIGLGGSLVNQRIGTTHSLSANLAYSYQIPLGENGLKLAVGLQGGFTNYRADLTDLDVYDFSDDAFMEERPSYWLPNFGLGLYLHHHNFFVGASAPKLIEYDLRTENINTERFARTIRHYYFTAGAAIPFGSSGDVVFRPVILVKNAGLLNGMKKDDDPFKGYGAPTEFDLDLSMFFMEKLWVGTSLRSAVEKFNGKSSFDSVDFWAAYYLKKGLSFGVAYDFTLTELQGPGKGSFEVMLGYDFSTTKVNIYSPRYF